MARFETYRDAFPNARLTRKPNGVLEIALHTDGGKLVFNGHTHEQFVDLFHAIGEDRDTRAVILTGTGDAFMDAISPEGFDFFTPLGYDKIFREGRKVLANILDVEVPMITALNGPVLLHSEYALLTDHHSGDAGDCVPGQAAFRVRHRPWHSRGFGITCDHSENGKLVVTITAAFSARSAIT